MSTQPFDPVRYKAGQRREWDSASTGWKNWWKQIEQALQPVSDRMMELMDWSSPEEFVRFQQEALTQINAILSKYPAERQAEIWQAITEALRQYGTKDGGCHLENEVIVLVGRQ